MDIAQIVRYDELNIVAFVDPKGVQYYPKNPEQIRDAVDFAFDGSYLVAIYGDGRRFKFDEENQLAVSSDTITTLNGQFVEVIVPAADYFPVTTRFVHNGNEVTIPPTYEQSCVVCINGNYYMSRGFIKLRKRPTKLANNLIPRATISVFYNSFLKYYLTFDSFERPLFISADKIDYNVKHELSIHCGYLFVGDCLCSYGMPSRTGLGLCELLVSNGNCKGSYIHYEDGILRYGQQKYYGKFSFPNYNIYKTGKYVFAMNMINGNFALMW